jgi:putative membrane protein
MTSAIAILTGLVCLIHLYIMVLEMALWEKTRIRKVFGLSAEFAKQTRMMALNQGLYNGFLAAGLIWSFLVSDIALSSNIRLFFLGCIAIAGIVGAITVTKRILWIQTIPAMIPIVLILILNGNN